MKSRLLRVLIFLTFPLIVLHNAVSSAPGQLEQKQESALSTAVLAQKIATTIVKSADATKQTNNASVDSIKESIESLTTSLLPGGGFSDTAQYILSLYDQSIAQKDHGLKRDFDHLYFQHFMQTIKDDTRMPEAAKASLFKTMHHMHHRAVHSSTLTHLIINLHMIRYSPKAYNQKQAEIIVLLDRLQTCLAPYIVNGNDLTKATTKDSLTKESLDEMTTALSLYTVKQPRALNTKSLAQYTILGMAAFGTFLMLRSTWLTVSEQYAEWKQLAKKLNNVDESAVGKNIGTGLAHGITKEQIDAAMVSMNVSNFDLKERGFNEWRRLRKECGIPPTEEELKKALYVMYLEGMMGQMARTLMEDRSPEEITQFYRGFGSGIGGHEGKVHPPVDDMLDQGNQENPWGIKPIIGAIRKNFSFSETLYIVNALMRGLVGREQGPTTKLTAEELKKLLEELEAEKKGA